MRYGKILTSAVIILGFFVSISYAQSISEQIGLKPYGSYAEGQIDQVDLQNGNVFLHIPLFSLPQVGKLKLSYSLSLNNNAFRLEEAYDPITGENFYYYDKPDPLATAGPSIDFDQDLRVVYTGHSEEDVAYLGNAEPIDKVWPSFSVLDFTGSRHSLGFENGSKNVLHSSDGSGYTYLTQASDGNLWAWASTVYQDLWDDWFPGDLINSSGIKYSYDPYNSSTTISDPSGNNMHYNVGTALIDSIGRSIPDINCFFNSCAGNSSYWQNAWSPNTSGCPNLGVASQPAIGSVTWTVPGPNGSSQNYLLCFASVTYHTCFDGGACGNSYPWSDGPTSPDPSGGSPSGVPPDEAIATEGVVQSVVLPNGTYWGFVYDSSGNYSANPYPDYSNPSDDGSNIPIAYGDLLEVIYPTGGTISYTYGTRLGGAGSLINRAVSSRTTNDLNGNTAIWSYSINVMNSSNTGGTSIVTDPLGRDTVHQYLSANGGYYIPDGQPIETETDWLDGRQGSGQVMKSTSSQYDSVADPLEQGWYNSPNSVASLRARSTTTTLGTSSSTTGYSYSPLFTDSQLLCRYWNGLQQPVTCVSQGTTPTIMFSQPARTTVHGFDGAVVQDVATTFKFTNSSAYLQANLLALPASVVNYDLNGNITAQTANNFDEANGSPQGVYGNATSTQGWLNTTGQWLTNSIVYNSQGMPVQDVDALGNATLYTYDNTGIFPATVQQPTTNGVQHIDRYTWDANTGNTLLHTDQNGIQTQYYYSDPLGRITQVRAAVNTPTEAWTTYAYPSSTVVTVAQDQNTKGDGLLQSSTAYDGFSRPIHQSLPGGITTDTTYDVLGSVASVSNPHGATQSSTDGFTAYTYDVLGRKLLQCNPDNGTGASCTPGNSYQQWSYSGNITTHYDETRNLWGKTFDALGRLTNVVEPGNLQTNYSYDALGNLMYVNQVGNSAAGETPRTRSFVYDSLSRLTSATNPETGTISYSYDANNNVQTKTAPEPNSAPGSGQTVTTTYSYDALNRLTFKHYSDGNWPAGFGYDGKSETGAPLPVAPTNAIGRMSISSNTVDAATIYSYDPVGRVVQQNTCLPDDCSFGMTQRATYDLTGNVTSLSYPDGRVVTQGTDAAGHLQSVTFDNWNGQHVGYTYASAFTYTASGAQTEMTLGNGIYMHTPYNNRQQICQVWVSNPQQPLMDKHYGYANSDCGNAPGNNGNITQIWDERNNNRSQGFTYDSLNRLASFSNGDGSMQQSYSYDSFGNMSQSGTLSSGLTFGTNNQINTSGYGYDSSGNLTSFNNGVFTTSYGYNAENALINFNNGAAGYITSGDGKRIRKDAGGSWTEYIYFGEQVLAEKNSDGSWSDYIYANGQKIARADSYDVRIHFTGTNDSSNPGPYAWAYNVPLPGYTIQQGDKIAWRQYQTGPAVPRGGLGIRFSDGTYTNWVAVDQDGQVMNNDSTQNAWHYRVADLSQYAGLTIAAAWIDEDSGSGAGNWEEYFSDISFYRQDGTVTPIFDRQTSVSYPSFGFPWGGVINQTFEVNIMQNDAWEPMDTTTYYVGDHLGSTRLTASGGGWPMSSDTFYPFGQEQSQTGDPNHYKFTGKERDAESGLDNFGARYYGSSMSRFMSPDPLGGHIEDPQSLNKYAYVRNSPLLLTDPTGLDFTLACDENQNPLLCHRNNDTGQYEQGSYVKGSDGKFSFQATDVHNDSSTGGLVDQQGNSYKGFVDSSGVFFQKNGSSELSQGQWISGSKDTTFTQNGGALNGFGFRFFQPDFNQSTKGQFYFGGSVQQEEKQLRGAGFYLSEFDQKYNGLHGPGVDHFRGSSESIYDTAHFIVEQSGGGGNFHTGEVDPNHDILAHGVRDVVPNIIRNWFVPH